MALCWTTVFSSPGTAVTADSPSDVPAARSCSSSPVRITGSSLDIRGSASALSSRSPAPWNRPRASSRIGNHQAAKASQSSNSVRYSTGENSRVLGRSWSRGGRSWAGRTQVSTCCSPCCSRPGVTSAPTSAAYSGRAAVLRTTTVMPSVGPLPYIG